MRLKTALVSLLLLCPCALCYGQLRFASVGGEKGYSAMAPFSGTRFDLATGKFIEITKGIPITKTAKARIVSESYTKLKLTTKRLQELVDASTGLPNKDLDKFTAELEKLLSKYKV